mmetsp:Transcript_4634/g.9046  ORF Transcript_4634/g.9046 Transcript_4634/m.9046 type:complete len:468 (+) Transcript_4634:1315-2718(+)
MFVQFVYITFDNIHIKFIFGIKMLSRTCEPRRLEQLLVMHVHVQGRAGQQHGDQRVGLVGPVHPGTELYAAAGLSLGEHGRLVYVVMVGVFAVLLHFGNVEADAADGPVLAVELGVMKDPQIQLRRGVGNVEGKGSPAPGHPHGVERVEDDVGEDHHVFEDQAHEGVIFLMGRHVHSYQVSASQHLHLNRAEGSRPRSEEGEGRPDHLLPHLSLGHPLGAGPLRGTGPGLHPQLGSSVGIVPHVGMVFVPGHEGPGFFVHGGLGHGGRQAVGEMEEFEGLVHEIVPQEVAVLGGGRPASQQEGAEVGVSASAGAQGGEGIFRPVSLAVEQIGGGHEHPSHALFLSENFEVQPPGHGQIFQGGGEEKEGIGGDGPDGVASPVDDSGLMKHGFSESDADLGVDFLSDAFGEGERADDLHQEADLLLLRWRRAGGVFFGGGLLLAVGAAVGAVRRVHVGHVELDPRPVYV